MGLFSRHAPEPSFQMSPTASSQDHEKLAAEHDHANGVDPNASTDAKIHLHRGLRARQVTMIALGGALGSGLLIGTGSALARAGPASIFISYTILGFIVWIVLCSLGEMAAWLPLESGFTGVCLFAATFHQPTFWRTSYKIYLIAQCFSKSKSPNCRLACTVCLPFR